MYSEHGAVEKDEVRYHVSIGDYQFRFLRVSFTIIDTKIVEFGSEVPLGFLSSLEG